MSESGSDWLTDRELGIVLMLGVLVWGVLVVCLAYGGYALWHFVVA